MAFAGSPSRPHRLRLDRTKSLKSLQFAKSYWEKKRQEGGERAEKKKTESEELPTSLLSLFENHICSVSSTHLRIRSQCDCCAWTPVLERTSNPDMKNGTTASFTFCPGFSSETTEGKTASLHGSSHSISAETCETVNGGSAAWRMESGTGSLFGSLGVPASRATFIFRRYIQFPSLLVSGQSCSGMSTTRHADPRLAAESVL